MTTKSLSNRNITSVSVAFLFATLPFLTPPPVCEFNCLISVCQLACLFGNLLVLFQSVLEELASLEIQLNRLKEKAQLLWDEHAAGKGFVHRVSQLSAQYLALTNLTKVQ